MQTRRQDYIFRCPLCQSFTGNLSTPMSLPLKVIAVLSVVLMAAACAADEQSVVAPALSSGSTEATAGGAVALGSAVSANSCPVGMRTFVLNGSFEAPAVARGAALFIPASETSWSTNDRDSELEIWNRFGGVRAADGAQLSELNVRTSTTIWQDICVPAGASLPWSFAHRSRNGGLEEVRLVITELGEPHSVLVDVVLQGGIGTWATHSSSVPVVSNGIPLRFELRSESVPGSLDSGNLLDDVKFGIVPCTKKRCK